MPLLRTLLLALLVFVIWRMVRTVARVMSTTHRNSDRMRSQPPTQRKPPAEGFRDIQDADFEDLPPEKKKN